MEDKRIIELFFERSEKAIEESGKKYGGYISSVAYSILASNEDTEEVVNDTYLRAWNSIPPQRPQKLGAFLATIARNLALDRYSARRKERENIAAEAVLDELAECLPDTGGLSVEQYACPVMLFSARAAAFCLFRATLLLMWLRERLKPTLKTILALK